MPKPGMKSITIPQETADLITAAAALDGVKTAARQSPRGWRFNYCDLSSAAVIRVAVEELIAKHSAQDKDGPPAGGRTVPRRRSSKR